MIQYSIRYSVFPRNFCSFYFCRIVEKSEKGYSKIIPILNFKYSSIFIQRKRVNFHIKFYINVHKKNKYNFPICASTSHGLCSSEHMSRSNTSPFSSYVLWRRGNLTIKEKKHLSTALFQQIFPFFFYCTSWLKPW